VGSFGRAPGRIAPSLSVVVLRDRVSDPAAAMSGSYPGIWLCLGEFSCEKYSQFNSGLSFVLLRGLLSLNSMSVGPKRLNFLRCDLHLHSDLVQNV
jgi:hypothetical protein